MPRLILHIGTGKTGSTAIQRALKAAAGRLPAQGFAYPTGVFEHHNELEALVLPAPRWHRVHRVEYAGRESELEHEARQTVNRARDALAHDMAVVLSSEYLCSLPTAAIRDLVKHFQTPAVPATAVLYVRQPSAYLLSSLQQFLKHEHGIRDYMRTRYPFAGALTQWTRVLGQDAVEVREFSRTALVGGDVVTDFAAVLTKLTGRTVDLGDAGREANTALSAEECIVMQALKRQAGIGLDSAQRHLNRAINAAVVRAARGMTLTRLQFRPGVAELVDRHHADDLAFLRRRSGIHFGLEVTPLDDAGRTGLERLCAVDDVGDLVDFDPASVSQLLTRARASLASRPDAAANA